MSCYPLGRSQKGDPKDVPIGLTLGICFGSVTVVMVLVCCILKRRTGRRFARTIQNARLAVEQQEAKQTAAAADIILTSGGYKATYRAVAEFDHMTIHLDFIPVTKDNKEPPTTSSRPPNAWKLSGVGQRKGMPFEISEGRVAPNGLAYWVERCHPGNKNGTMLILNTGTFDFANDTFRGRWETPQGDSTLYIEFELDEDATVQLELELDVEEENV